MPTDIDFNLGRFEDGTLTISMAPATNISGWSLQFTMWKRPNYTSGSVSGLITKSAASGFNNVSGINVTNGAQGVFNVNLGPLDISGDIDPGAYYYKIERRDSGVQTITTQGYRLMAY